MSKDVRVFMSADDMEACLQTLEPALTNALNDLVEQPTENIGTIQR